MSETVTLTPHRTEFCGTCLEPTSQVGSQHQTVVDWFGGCAIDLAASANSLSGHGRLCASWRGLRNHGVVRL